jgi:hypothetical protein
MASLVSQALWVPQDLRGQLDLGVLSVSRVMMAQKVFRVFRVFRDQLVQLVPQDLLVIRAQLELQDLQVLPEFVELLAPEVPLELQAPLVTGGQQDLEGQWELLELWDRLVQWVFVVLLL